MTSVLDHTPHRIPSLRRRIGAASAALALLTTAGLLLDQSGSARGATAIGLGPADGFAVLAGSGITNTGRTVITGDIGSFPLATVVGESDIVLTGTHQDGTVTAGAKAGLLTAYGTAAAQPSTQSVAGELAPTAATLTPGVYTSSSSMGLTGALTLDGGGDPDAVFVFQAGSTLTTGPGSSVVLIGGAQACNVFWQVGSSATLDTDTTFVGTILADTSITLNARASVAGRVLASNGAVTMDNNVITRPVCASTPSPGPTAAPTTPAAPVADQPAAGTPATGGATASGPATTTSGRDGSVRQVPRVPVGSVDAGDGSARASATRE